VNLKISAFWKDMPVPIYDQEDMVARFFPLEMLLPIYQNTRGHNPKQHSCLLKTFTNFFFPTEVTLNQNLNYRGADKSLARPGMKQAISMSKSS
jgi:hypothetical protein